jgi:AcrR family transcriptional regulator
MRTLNSLNSTTEGKRLAIIAAALDCFVEMGYTQATMEKIRERAVVSNGSVYHHFRSKEDLAAAVYVEGITSYQKCIAGAVFGAATAESGVREIVHRHLDWVSENKSWAAFLFRMRHADFMETAEGSLKDANTHFLKPLSEWFKKHRTSGAIRDMSFPIYISLILGPCQEFSRLWLTGGLEIDLPKAKNDIAGGVWRAIGTNT